MKLWEVPGRSHVDLNFSRSTCDLFAQHANAQSHKFNMAKRRTTTTWAHAGVTKRYRDRWKAMTMGNGPNDNRHVVWALGVCFQRFLNILPQFWPIFLTFRALFTCLDVFSNTVNHLRPLQRVFQSFPAFLCPHIIPQLPQPFPMFAFSASITHFYVFSTNLNRSRVPQRTYTPLWPTLAVFEPNSPFLKPHTHSWPQAPFPAISPFPQLLPCVFTCLRVRSTTHKYLNAFQSVHTHFRDCPGIFNPFPPIFDLF